MADAAALTLPGSLPVPRTRLIGRETEIAAAHALLLDEAIPLLTLTGPGGVGKTRLALAVAAAAAEHFADGVRFVALAPITDPDLVLGVIAQALGVRETGHEPLLDQVQAVLCDQHRLLVLDNVEQVVEAAPLLAQLVTTCPRLAIAVTSRVRLRLADEREFPVRPLALPELDDAAARAAWEASPAVQLFAQRAQAVNPDFALTEQNGPIVAAICRQLDGLPLAIELAAVRSKALPPAALLSRLTRRLPLLTGGARDRPPRHQTMRAAIAWSYDLLPSAEQALFRRLAVFVGSFTLEAAEVVCRGPDGTSTVVDGVLALQDQSLLRLIDGEQPRYVMLETVREFGIEQLAATGEDVAMRERHARWCLEFVTSRDALRAEAWDPAWIAAVDAELPNLRAALAWLLAADAEAATHLACALVPAWWSRNRLSEATDWLDRVLTTRMEPDRGHVLALIQLGAFPHAAGDYAKSEGLLQAALHFAERLHAEDLLAFAHYHLGECVELSGDDETAGHHYEAGLAVARRLDHPFLTSLLLENLGDNSFHRGDLERAAALSTEALTLLAPLGAARHVAIAHTTLAWIDIERGDPGRAAARFQTALATALALDDPWFIGNALAGVAALAQGAGDARRAARLFGAAEAQRARSGRPTLPYAFQHERVLAALRQQLGIQALQEASAAGQAQALTATLGELQAQGTSGVDVRAQPPSAPILTPREAEVLRLIARGLTDQQIGDTLFVSRRTVTSHVAHILAKLAVPSRAAAVAAAMQHGLG